MSAPTYAFYTDTYGGALSADVFNGWVAKAQTRVDDLISYRTPSEAQETAYKMAVCAAVDALEEYGDGTGAEVGYKLGSFSVGSNASQGGAVGRGSAPSSAGSVSDAARFYLAPTGLLFQGVR